MKTIPKFYTYSVIGILNEDKDLKRFTVPSLGRDIEDEFDLDGVVQYAALNFFLADETYKDVSIWPLTFKISGGQVTKEVEVMLDFAPTFSLKEKKVLIKKQINEEVTKTPRKRRTKAEMQNEATSS